MDQPVDAPKTPEISKESAEKDKKILTPAQVENLRKMREKKAIKKKAVELLNEQGKTVPQAPAPTPAPASGLSESDLREAIELKKYLQNYLAYKDAKKAHRESKSRAQSVSVYDKYGEYVNEPSPREHVHAPAYSGGFYKINR